MYVATEVHIYVHSTYSHVFRKMENNNLSLHMHYLCKCIYTSPRMDNKQIIVPPNLFPISKKKKKSTYTRKCGSQKMSTWSISVRWATYLTPYILTLFWSLPPPFQSSFRLIFSYLLRSLKFHKISTFFYPCFYNFILTLKQEIFLIIKILTFYRVFTVSCLQSHPVYHRRFIYQHFYNKNLFINY